MRSTPTRGIQRQSDGTCMMRMEWLWTRVKRWAKRHGHEYNDSYGVVGVAATWGYLVAFWFRKLKIGDVGIINLDMDDEGEWFATWQQAESSS
jgi:hypothetical protein